MPEEAVLASRDFINEGEFLPEVTSSADVGRRASTASPPLLGYVATTAKPQAATLLRIGPDRDPLLARGRSGSGRATAWTRDASARWSQHWAAWDGYVDFWTGVVQDTFARPRAAPGVHAPGRGRHPPGDRRAARAPSPTAPRPPPGSSGPTSSPSTCRSSAAAPASSPARCRSPTPAPTPSAPASPGPTGRRCRAGSTLATLSYPRRVRARRARRGAPSAGWPRPPAGGAPSSRPRRSTPPDLRAGRTRDRPGAVVRPGRLPAVAPGRRPVPAPAAGHRRRRTPARRLVAAAHPRAGGRAGGGVRDGRAVPDPGPERPTKPAPAPRPSRVREHHRHAARSPGGRRRRARRHAARSQSATPGSQGGDRATPMCSVGGPAAAHGDHQTRRPVTDAPCGPGPAARRSAPHQTHHTSGLTWTSSRARPSSSASRRATCTSVSGVDRSAGLGEQHGRRSG